MWYGVCEEVSHILWYDTRRRAEEAWEVVCGVTCGLVVQHCMASCKWCGTSGNYQTIPVLTTCQQILVRIAFRAEISSSYQSCAT
ncbi:hypothetical protein E2C01_049036 [Portunus trituberculatus]|uniref:Uncharacterized protein n=1 Tax=Portunus trituberculatus TaxID=210409 RepID=A0A5B7G845_PORTR|nr:hypothetical protein [Portunus trituberculatus]